jgi:hypothetical protein
VEKRGEGAEDQGVARVGLAVELIPEIKGTTARTEAS